MAIRRNSRPFSFRSFQGEEPTGEELRTEVEDIYNYLQDSLGSLKFSDIGGSFTTDQQVFIDNRISSVVVGINDSITAAVTRIDTIEAIVLDPRTGLVASRAAITLEQRVRATRDTAFAQQISIVSAQVGNSYAAITEERLARVNADGSIVASLTTEVLARQTGDTTLQANITTEAIARISADGVVTANLSTEVAARISGDSTLSASITSEASARASADGNLSAKYTLTATVSSGSVTVTTGMNITSAIGPGTNISSVVFRATDFQIWNSTPDIGVPMFDISGSTVRLAGTLVVSTSGKVYIGTGTFNDASTPFYVDNTGQMSLKDKLSWDLTTLSVSGTITSTSGTIGGFALSSNSLSATSIAMSTLGPRFQIGTSGAERVEMEIVTSRARFSGFISTGVRTITLQADDGATSASFLSLTDSGSATGMTLSGNGKISVKTSLASSPAFSFLTDGTTGIYNPSSNRVGLAGGGQDIGQFIWDGSKAIWRIPGSGIIKFGAARAAVGVMLVQYYVPAEDSAGNVINLAVVA